jgi:hypothetical protein
VNQDNNRLIGFGRYAGNVGAYNGIRAFGIKYDLFQLPKAETLNGKAVLVEKLKRLILPPIKIVVTGSGKADKDQVRKSVLKQWKDIVINNDDESDSLAVGLTYFKQQGIL